MPQIVFKGIQKVEATSISKDLAESLAEAINCPKEWISLELTQADYFNLHSKEAAYPVVNIFWFSRPKEVQDKVAGILNEALFKLGYSRLQVYFHRLDPSEYYEFK